MEKMIVWRTASNRYSPFLGLEKPESAKVVLTTIKDLQRNGTIQLYCRQGSRRELLEAVRVDNLPVNHPGDPVVTLSGSFDGKKSVRVSVETRGRTCYSKTLKLPGYMRPRKEKGPLLVILLLLILAGAGVVLFISPGIAVPVPDSRNEKSAEAARPHTPPSEPSVSLPEKPAGTLPKKQALAVPDIPAEKAPPPIAVPEKPPTVAPEQPAQKIQSEPAPALPVFTLEPVIIYFHPEEAVLQPQAKAALDRLAENLKGQDLSRLSISGHCALFGDEAERLELSLKRARTAADYLRSRGLVLPGSVRISGDGGTRPLTRDRDRQELNRRVEVRLLPL